MYQQLDNKYLIYMYQFCNLYLLWVHSLTFFFFFFYFNKAPGVKYFLNQRFT
jgi:hypothetical protein